MAKTRKSLQKKKNNIVQVYNPANKVWVKLDTENDKIISAKSTPYKHLKRYK